MCVALSRVTKMHLARHICVYTGRYLRIFRTLGSHKGAPSKSQFCSCRSVSLCCWQSHKHAPSKAHLSSYRSVSSCFSHFPKEQECTWQGASLFIPAGTFVFLAFPKITRMRLARRTFVYTGRYLCVFRTFKNHKNAPSKAHFCS